MAESWLPRDTNTHQDHVIAHVLGTTVLGHFVFDEALYILLDIGFVWTILLDGEMGLLLHPVAIGELTAEQHFKEEVRADIDLLLKGNSEAENLLRMTAAPLHTDATHWEICEVNFFEMEDDRRLVLNCEASSLVIETSVTSGEIKVYDGKQGQF